MHELPSYHPVFPSRPQPDDDWPYDPRPSSPRDRQFGVKAPKYERHIFLRRDIILYSIDAQLNILAEARKLPDGTVDDTITNATTKYQQLFYGWINTHIGEAKTVMAALVLDKHRESTMNSIRNEEETDITLLVPEWYDDTTFQQLTNAVSTYVIAATIVDFFSLRLSSKDPTTLDLREQREEAKSEIRKLANMSKPGRIAKPLKPF